MIEKTPRALPRDVPDYHARQAEHLRALADVATTDPLKKRLRREAEAHELVQQQVANADD
jgi:hypothetical protein